ncbi:MAG: Na(+)-translocating NADH-quinone reductase subunit C [Oceanospirillales bacterium LUC14_002_19_P2]|nr:MAG: Na(+)-translocating NADH-quinone reductase subunit C [Oceanospirillales bacterium LUC14_002_19_P2]
MANNDTIKKTLLVTITLSLVCSVLVSGAAVALKSRQNENKVLDVQQNILAISGLVADPKALSRQEIQEEFSKITPKLVDLETGKFDAKLDVDTFNQQAASKDPAMSNALPADQDKALIKRLEKTAKIYVVEKDGKLETVILPVRGYGLWSTLYGFLALESDLNTVAGFGFYQHAETPGLGGEVDNPRWKGLWIGKEVFDDKGNIDITVVKGAVDPSASDAKHKVDGLSGATLTSRGVDNLVKFWLGKNGFGPFLNNLKKGEA